MINRLPELHYFIKSQQNPETERELSFQTQDIENEKPSGIDSIFFSAVKAIKFLINNLNANNHQIQNLQSKYSKAIKSVQEKDISQQMDQILNDNSIIQKNLKKNLAEVEMMVKKSEEEEPQEPETKMKKYYFLSLTKEASDTLKAQQSFEDEYRKTVRGKVSRQVRLIDPNLNEQEVQYYVEKPQLAQEMMEKKIYGQASVRLKNTVSDIQDKFRDIKKLQSSIHQCMELFNQLSTLIQSQGQKLDSVEGHLVDCKDYITKAEVKLRQAKEHQECSKKCKCFFIIAGLVLVIVIIIVLSTTL